jgi:hypothetical protein
LRSLGGEPKATPVVAPVRLGMGISSSCGDTDRHLIE